MSNRGVAVSARRLCHRKRVRRYRVTTERQRIDKWLWHARVVKARTSAAELVESGHVRVNGARETSPGHAIKIGDVLTIALDRTVRVLKVTAFNERRGDAASARVLYEEVNEAKRN